MSCINIPKITSEQIKICEQCKHASGKKLWCCKLGFYFKQPEHKIIHPDRKLTLLRQTQKAIQTPRAKPTLIQMAADFAKAMIRWSGKGFACVSKDEYIKRRSICSECTGGWRCPHCGCMLWAKIALATEKCPAGKWG